MDTGLPSVAAAADGLTVCATGCDHTTFAAAVAAAAAGDTVRVTEDLEVAGSTRSGEDITVTGGPGITVTQTRTTAATFPVTGDGATVSDLESPVRASSRAASSR